MRTYPYCLILMLLLCSERLHALTVTVVHHPTDCTANLQAAFDGPADTIIIPNVGTPWTTGPLLLNRNNVTLILEPGVELVAKLGAFRRNATSLIRVFLCSQIKISGYGATLRMLNGIDPDYLLDENRHCLEIRSVDSIVVDGLTCTKSGGDGIYVADGWSPGDTPYSRNVLIRDCVLDDNRRQGISVISAQDLVIEHCIFRDIGVTSGTDPKAGIDFEPDQPSQRIVRCTVRDSSFSGSDASNYASGIHIALLYLDATSQPVSIDIERCHITSTRNEGVGLRISGPRDDDGPLTVLKVSDCFIENTRGIGLLIISGRNLTTTTINRTVLQNTYTNTSSWGGAPIYLEAQDPSFTSYGNITFNDCLVVDDRPRPFLRSYEGMNHLVPPRPNTFCNGLYGTITVINPNPSGHVMNLGSTGNDLNINLAITALTTPPTQSVSVAPAPPEGSEGSEGSIGGGYTLTRSSPDLRAPLAISLAWSGTALNGDDFRHRPSFALIPPGGTSTNFALVARADGIPENEELATLTMIAHPVSYSIATAFASVRLYDTQLLVWRFNQFLTSANSGSAANLATPAGDGVQNLLKYSFNMIGNGAGQDISPTSPNVATLLANGSAGLPRMSTDGTGKLQLTHIRRKASSNSGITYTVEFSSTLAAGSWAVNDAATTSVTSIDSTFERVTVTDSSAVGKRFARVRVSAL